MAGKIFDHSIKMFNRIAVLQPVMNGVGGNLVAVQSSRISSYLHCQTKLGALPKEISRICSNPSRAFYNGTKYLVKTSL
jgi:solute carrier family 41